MKLINRYLFIAIILHFFVYTTTFSQNIISKDIRKAIIEGNSKKLAVFFNTNVKLIIEGTEDVYSKTQAILIIENFLKKNKPNDFSIIFEGVNSNFYYAMCILTTSLKYFNIYIFFQTIKNKTIIHQFEVIEKKQ